MSTELGTSPASRRKFLSVMAAAGLGAAAANVFGGQARAPQKGPLMPITSGGKAPSGDDGILNTIPPSDFTGIPGSNIDFQVLNFALTLELLEADIYRQALNLASGRAITTALSSDRSVYKRNVATGGLSSEEANVGFLYLRDFAYVEAAHRDFLSAAITQAGGTPTTANAKGYQFIKTPTAQIKQILEAILPLEETGTRAYLGAIRSLDSYAYAQVAATIFSTECRHSSAIRLILGQAAGPSKQKGDLSDPAVRPADNTYEYYLEPQTVLAGASAYFVK